MVDREQLRLAELRRAIRRAESVGNFEESVQLRKELEGLEGRRRAPDRGDARHGMIRGERVERAILDPAKEERL